MGVVVDGFPLGVFICALGKLRNRQGLEGVIYEHTNEGP
jgi:hypothetical protein